jgi:hypothetical protein
VTVIGHKGVEVNQMSDALGDTIGDAGNDGAGRTVADDRAQSEHES